jgi:Leucine-rich repeat (LRR) protein
MIRFIFYFAYFFNFYFVVCQQLSSVEYDALHDLYLATNGPSWIYRPSNTSVPWNFSLPDANPCEDSWQGVSCACDLECNVHSLVLNGHNLTGTVPDSIGNLQHCEELDLSYNSIRSQFPESVGSMVQLKVINLRMNQLIGSLPATMGSLTALREVDYSGNDLRIIPESFYNNKSTIELLNVGRNYVEGSISPRIDQLTHLKLLTMDLNLLNGSIPATIGNLVNLTVLQIQLNYMTGVIPENIGNLKLLEEFDISFNFFASTIPSSVGNLLKLTNFLVNVNTLFGKLPPSFGNTSMRYLDCDQNLLSGPIPSTFSKLDQLFWLYMTGNSFTGEINVISSVHSIYGVALARNFFYGEVSPLVFGSPKNSQQFKGLFEFAAEFNSLSGALPITNKTQIVEYQLSNNYFTGNIPTNYSNFFSGINYFSVDHNYLFGTIPQALLTAKHLTTINASYNLFTGSLFLPSAADIGQNIVQLCFENNFFTGTISSSCGNLEKLVTFTVSNNELSGTVPATFRNLQNLKVLSLNNNKLQGSMNLLLSEGLPSNMTTIDLSNNQFTGSLASEFFQNKSSHLETFIAVSNCLTGSLPESICLAKSLVSLVLDGLSTAENCRIQLFNNIPFIDSFTLKNGLDGSVPICFYSVPTLETLHLSGNGLTGSIPSNDVQISSSLTDLTLSHNTLTGTIPESFQYKYWLNLDLSYNKITGTLSTSSFNALNSQNSTLSLDVNRLSGNFPSSLLNLDSISVLNGNLFGCNLEGNDLPSHDPDFKSYSCGSNTVNDLLYVWAALIGLLMIGCISYYFYYLHRSEDAKERVTEAEYLEELKLLMFKIREYYQKVEEFSSLNPSSNISKLHRSFQNLRKIVFLLSLLLVIVFLPVYVILTAFYQTYEVEYAWNVSAVLLSSSVAAVVLLLLFTGITALLYILLLRSMPQAKEAGKNSSSQSISTRGTESSSLSSFVISDLFRMNFETVLTYVFIFLFDFVVMIFADILYILVVINYGAVEITLAAIALAIFRIVSNNILARKSIPATRYYCSKLLSRGHERHTEDSPGNNTVNRKEDSYVVASNTADVAFLEIMTLFNILLIPVLVVLITLPDCFYNAFIQSANVSSSFSFRLCEEYFEFSFGSISVSTGIFCVDQTQNTSYTPPFIYLYQCSSKIIIYYVPVYLILFLISGVLFPLKNFLVFAQLTWREGQNSKQDSKEANSVLISCNRFFRFLTPASLRPLISIRHHKKRPFYFLESR